MAKETNMLDALRERAEQLIFAGKNSSPASQFEVKKFFQELQIHQFELEMQNDELQKNTVELEQHRINFSSLFELAPTGYFVTNESGIIENVNLAGAILLKFDKGNLVNKPFLFNVFKEDRDQFHIYFHRLFTSGNAETCYLRLVKQNEEVIDTKIDGIAVQNLITNNICYLTITDYTEKQQAEQKLKEANKTLEIALKASSTGIWEIDMVTGKFYLDDFCLALYGFENGGFDGNYETLVNRSYIHDRKNVDYNIREAILQEKELDIKFRADLPDYGIRYIQARAQIITDQHQKKRFLGTFTDISDKMLKEIEVQRVKEEQQQMILSAGLQAEENEKKRISEVLHNGIAQMLYAVKLNIDQLRNSEERPSFDYLMQLLNQSINDIRNISFELAPSILTDFGLAATLEDMASRLSGNQLSVQTKVSPNCKSLPFQIQLNIFRIIQELVNNSIKHGKATAIQIEIDKKARNTFITITDNGIGFDTHKNNGTPKGIGLSSIKNRLRLYKGTLTIESSPSAGATVQVSLKH